MAITPKIITSYKNKGFTFFTSSLSAKTNEKGEIKKELEVPQGWNNKDFQTSYNLAHNAIAIKTGEISNLLVIDIDDITLPLNNELYYLIRDTLEDKLVYASTRKGYHIYFKYTTKINNGNKITNYFPKLDIIANNAFIFAPPTQYYDENDNQYTYKWEQDSENKEIPEMPEEIITFLINKKQELTSEKTNKVEYNESTEINALNEVKFILKNLNPNNYKTYTEWISLLWGCHNMAYQSLNDFQEFCERMDNYTPDFKYQNEETWEKAKKDKDSKKIKIGSMLSWLKRDNAKAFDEFYRIYRKQTTIYEDPAYLEWKEKFELNNFKHKCEFITDYFKNGEIIIDRHQKDKFKIKYEDKGSFFDKDGKEHLCIDVWFKDQNKRHYEDVDFIINDCPETTFNLFRGFKAEKLQIDTSNITKEQKLDKLKNITRLMRNLAGDSEDGFNLFTMWCANIVQKKQNSRMFIILRDGKDIKGNSGGVGKNSFIDFFGRDILGEQIFIEYTDPSAIFERFNTLLDHKVFVHIPEANGAIRDKWDTFKNIVSAQTINIEYKGDTKFNQTNNLNLILSTNHNECGWFDRRLCIFDCSKKDKNNREYWSQLHKELKDPLIQKLFYEYLLNDVVVTPENPTQWEAERMKLSNNALNELKNTTIPQTTKFLAYLCETKRYNDNHKLTTTSLYEVYANWVHANGFGKLSSKSFGMELTKFVNDDNGKNYIKKPHANKGEYVINFTSLTEFFKNEGLIIENVENTNECLIED
jgi:phage/plasmid-associated DNA primase